MKSTGERFKKYKLILTTYHVYHKTIKKEYLIK